MLVENIPLNEIHEDFEQNSRGKIAPTDVFDLVQSIREQGLLQPINIRKYSPEKEAATGYKYGLISGFRRLNAYKALGNSSIPAHIEYNVSDADALIKNLIENVVRKDLNILQEAKALERLKFIGVTQAEVAKQLNKSTGWVQLRFKLLEFDEAIQKECANGVINTLQIGQLATLSPAKRIEQVKKIKDQKLRGEKNVTVTRPVSQNSKRARTRGEMNKMLDHIYDFLGPSFATRVLAWSVGNVSSLELFQDIKEQCQEKGTYYTIPEEEL